MDLSWSRGWPQEDRPQWTSAFRIIWTQAGSCTAPALEGHFLNSTYWDLLQLQKRVFVRPGHQNLSIQMEMLAPFVQSRGNLQSSHLSCQEPRPHLSMLPHPNTPRILWFLFSVLITDHMSPQNYNLHNEYKYTDKCVLIGKELCCWQWGSQNKAFTHPWNCYS